MMRDFNTKKIEHCVLATSSWLTKFKPFVHTPYYHYDVDDRALPAKFRAPALFSALHLYPPQDKVLLEKYKPQIIKDLSMSIRRVFFCIPPGEP